jgi:glycine cleavage system H protein
MSDRHYTKDHEWVEVDGDVATIGITRYAADKLGDVVYVDLPKVGATVAASTVVGEIESTKSVGELFAPVDGEVVEANQDVVGDPSTINADADAAWLIKVRFTALPELLTAEQYAELTAE